MRAELEARQLAVRREMQEMDIRRLMDEEAAMEREERLRMEMMGRDHRHRRLVDLNEPLRMERIDWIQRGPAEVEQFMRRDAADFQLRHGMDFTHSGDVGMGERRGMYGGPEPGFDMNRPMMRPLSPSLGERRPDMGMGRGMAVDVGGRFVGDDEELAPLPPIFDDAIGEGGNGRRHARDFNPQALALRKMIISVSIYSRYGRYLGRYVTFLT